MIPQILSRPPLDHRITAKLLIYGWDDLLRVWHILYHGHNPITRAVTFCATPIVGHYHLSRPLAFSPRNPPKIHDSLDINRTSNVCRVCRKSVTEMLSL